MKHFIRKNPSMLWMGGLGVALFAASLSAQRSKPRATLGEDRAHRVMSVAFSPDGKFLAAATGNTVEIWDVAAGKRTAILRGHAYEVMSVAFSPDGKTLASGSDDETIKLWDVAAGKGYGHAARAVHVVSLRGVQPGWQDAGLGQQ